jgi:replicative DNA helicase
MAIRPPVAEGGGSRVSASPAYERIPPHNIEAEESVLGSMLLSRDAIAEVLELLHEDDFYRPAHRTVFNAILGLYSHGHAVDAVTVSEELRRGGQLADIGGAPFIHTLLASVPTAANAGYYARIVKETGMLRRLIDAGTRIVQLGYETPQDVERAVDTAESLVYQVAQGRVSEDYLSLREVLTSTLEAIERLHDDHREITGVPTGFPDLDRITSGLQPSNLIIVAARPAVGKSTLGLDIVRNASVKAGVTSVIFSLEMSKSELVQRLMCAECSVDMQRLRTGRMDESDWTRLTRSLGRLADAPLFIDDSASTTLMEIRAKCRRLKQRQGLGLVVVDYLQLMQPTKKVDNRQQEVSEMSRGLKLLAKELEVPVIAISQLSRNPEARSDKKPMLSDLRESGCLTADTRILRADTSAEITLGELLSRGERNIPVWTLDENFKLVPGTMTHVFPSGVKPIFELRLASGRRIKASGNHPFRTVDGWRALEELKLGSRIAVSRTVPDAALPESWPEPELVMLAHLIGDGCVASRQPIHYTSADIANIEAVEKAAVHFGIMPRRVAQKNWWHVYLPSPYKLARGKRNPIAAWLDQFGLYGLPSGGKFIPHEIFSLPKEQIALFLRHLWATDGSVQMREGLGVIYYASNSRRLIEGLQALLLRLNIYGRIKKVQKSGYEPGYHLVLYGAENQLNFLDLVGVHGARGAIVDSLASMLRPMVERANTNLDTIPIEIWSYVRNRMRDVKVTTRAFQAAIGTKYCGSTLYKAAPGRARLMKIAATLEDQHIHNLACSDVFWDAVVTIDSLGEEPVYDATVLGTHNFIANGIVVHNSLEQDADCVLFIYRDEVYDPESPRKGEADLILAKHRNGPTDTVVVTFQGQYSRFAPMAARSL